MTTARRAARAAAARARVPPPSFDWRDSAYGISRWPPAPDNPVAVTAIHAARRRAREARRAWELEHHQDEP